MAASPPVDMIETLLEDCPISVSGFRGGRALCAWAALRRSAQQLAGLVALCDEMDGRWTQQWVLLDSRFHSPLSRRFFFASTLKASLLASVSGPSGRPMMLQRMKLEPQ